MSSGRKRLLSTSVLRPIVSAFVLGVVALSASPSFAQDAIEDDDTIVVTGSRIRSPLSQNEPIVNIGQDEIARTGLSSTADILQRTPISGGGLNTRFNSSGNFGNPPDGGGVGAGAAEIDLRYLGTPRTLVLVDGLRWVNGASGSGVPGSVDLNTIPSGMIDRIEVLQQGASTIYGSDAIAGVVNIITRDEQDGLIASAQYGGYTEYSDGITQEYNASFGLNSRGTHIIVGVGYVDQDDVLAADRDIAQFPTPGATACDNTCSSGTPLGRFIITDPNTLQELDVTLAGAFPPGGFASYNPALVNGGPDWVGFTTASRFNFQPFNYIVTPSERLSMFGQIVQDLPHGMEFRLRASYVERQSANQAAPLPLFVGPDAGNGNLLDTVVIAADNPYNPFGFELGAGTLTFIGRRLVEAGPRHYEQNVDTINLTATLSGAAQLFGNPWDWDFNVVWSENKAEQTFTGNVNAQRVVQALGPLAGCTNPCVPLNMFGGAGTITPEMLAYIGFTQRDSSEQNLLDFSYNITGDLMNLPAGPLSAAFGIENRHTDGRFDPDPIVAAGFSSDIPAQPAQGEIEVREAYAEFRIPLIRDAAFARELTASVAARIFDYSTSGQDSTFQAGLNWRPTEDVLVRFNWGEGFRAPSIGELYGTASRFDQEVIDPCSNLLAQPANVQTNCINAGVPGDGSYTQLNPQLPVITSGNPGLQPETSEGYNLGVVWQPSFWADTAWSDRISFEVNYSNIELDGAIKAQDGQALLDRCAETGDALACATITRTPTGTVSAISNPLINIGGIETQAVDFTVAWTSPEWSMGTFSLRSTTNFLLEYNELVPTSTGIVAIAREGTERGSPDQAYPEVKSTVSLDWDWRAFGATATARYISEVDETGAANSLDATTYWDFQARWTPAVLDERITIALGVNNLTDEDPPGCFTCGLNNFDPTTYDPPGRFGYIRFSYRQ